VRRSRGKSTLVSYGAEKMHTLEGYGGRTGRGVTTQRKVLVVFSRKKPLLVSSALVVRKKGGVTSPKK